jgi:hypothetical protein
MAEELGWSERRKEAEFSEAGKYLGTMGLPISLEGVALADVRAGLGAAHFDLKSSRMETSNKPVSPIMIKSSSLFESSELDNIREVFRSRAMVVEREERVETKDTGALVKSLSMLKGVGPKDVAYVLEETGYKAQKWVAFDEFLEVCHCFPHLTKR